MLARDPDSIQHSDPHVPWAERSHPSNSPSPAALWLAAFSPPSVPLTSSTPALLTPEPFALSLPVSPAAQFLTSFSSPPPSSSLTHQNTNIINGWQLGNTIGSGISQVRLATSLATGAVVAVKLVRHTNLTSVPDEMTRLRREEQVWSALNHEYILPLFSVHHAPEFTAFFTLYCPDGTLLGLVTKSQNSGGVGLEGDLVRSIFREVTRGLQYLHESMGIVHGDIKLDNILIDDNGTCRIGDFGNAQYFRVGWEEPLADHYGGREVEVASTMSHHMSLRRSRGTTTPRSRPRQASDVFSMRHTALETDDIVLHTSLPYAAPELLQRTLNRPGECLPSQDIWALGCVLHGLLTGALPFADAYEPRLLLKILNGEWENRSLTRDADRVILRGCLRIEVEERWSIGKLAERVHEVGAVDYVKVASDLRERERQRGRKSAKSRSRSRIRHTQTFESRMRSKSKPRRTSRDSSHERTVASSSKENGARLYPDRSTSRPRGRTSVAALPHLSTSHSKSWNDSFASPADRWNHRAVFTSDEEHSSTSSYIEPRRAPRAPSSESRAASTELLTPSDEFFSLHSEYHVPRSVSRGRSRVVEYVQEEMEDEEMLRGDATGERRVELTSDELGQGSASTFPNKSTMST